MVAKADKYNNKRLVGYVVAAADFNKEAAINYLENKLPEYMVPVALVQLEQIPLTASGKTDTKRLPEPEFLSDLSAVYEAPRNIVEEQLVNIWQQLLQLPRIGIHDNFFALGGHSLIMIRILSFMRKAGFDAELKELFAYQTISELATVITKRKLTTAFTIGQGLLNDQQSSATANQHLLLLQQEGDELPVFILPGTYGVSDSYDELAKAFKGIAPVYGIQMQGVFEGEQPLNNVPEIASLNIQWIREVQPKGPYRLIGHSFGGHVAYEMARQLEQVGESLELVAILDIAAAKENKLIGLQTADVVMEIARQLFEAHKLIAAPYPAWVTQLRRELSALEVEQMVPYIAQFISDKIDAGNNLPFILQMLHLQVTNLFMKYTAQEKLRSELIVAKAADENWNGDNTLGWRNLSVRVDTVTIPGTHLGMVAGENALILGGFLKQKLKAGSGQEIS